LQHTLAPCTIAAMPDEVVVIKKYSNRRLYDTSASRYITLEELTQKLRAGADVVVEDAKTGHDLTQATLTQIILEQKSALLPVPLLKQLLRMDEGHLAEFFAHYMTFALEMYQRARWGASQIAPFNPLANVPFAASDALARLFLGAASTPAPPQPAPPPPSPPRSDVEDLRRELEELKRSLRKPRRR
jgi:polyhydroxyalkanoate synthesis repressor PhaR